MGLSGAYDLERYPTHTHSLSQMCNTIIEDLFVITIFFSPEFGFIWSLQTQHPISYIRARFFCAFLPSRHLRTRPATHVSHAIQITSVQFFEFPACKRWFGTLKMPPSLVVAQCDVPTQSIADHNTCGGH